MPFTYLSRDQLFDLKWNPDRNTGCWIWNASLNEKGYGKFWNGKETAGAHRYSWQREFRTPIPSGMCICHTCDTPACVNPSHLFLGTKKDNWQDCLSKGRRKYERGYGIKWETVRIAGKRRKTLCKRGHPLSGSNLYISPSLRRECKECRNESRKAWRKFHNTNV